MRLGDMITMMMRGALGVFERDQVKRSEVRESSGGERARLSIRSEYGVKGK